MTPRPLLPLDIPIHVLVEQLRVDAAEPVKDVFHRRSEAADRIPGWNRTVIARARKAATCNPLYRVGLLILAARLAGLPRAAGEQLAGFNSSLVNQLWPTTDISIHEALQLATRADSAESNERTDYLATRDPAELAEWIVAAEKDRAALDVAIATARMRVLSMQRGIAA